MFEPLEARKLLTDIDIQVLSRVFLDAALDEARNSPEADVIQWKDADGNFLSGTINMGGTELSIPDGVTINGNGGITLNAQDDSRVVLIEDNAAVTLSGLALTHGRASRGGGIYNGGNLTLINSYVTENKAMTADGGGIYNTGAARLTMTGSTVFANFTPNGFGGGMYSSSGAMVYITQSTISGNFAEYSGGGIYNKGSMTVDNSTVSGNSSDYIQTDAYDQGGGGIYNTGTMELRRSTVSGNTSKAAGGGVNNVLGFGTLTVTNSTIAENSAATYGGGVFGDAFISNSTIAYNSSAGYGGGWAPIGAGSTSIVTNTIVAMNTAALLGPEISGLVNTQNSHNNLIGTQSPAGGMVTGDGKNNLTGVDPKFKDAGVTDNGGPTKTIAVASDSPARHGGSLPHNMNDFDQRGDPFLRRADAVTIGAYEYDIDPLSLIVSTISDASDGNYSSGNLSLREAILISNNTSGSDTITFASGLNTQTITLYGTPLVISAGVTITGPGADKLAVSGNDLSRVFSFDSGISTLSGISVRNGNHTSGGGAGVHNSGTLTITASVLTGNVAALYGGAVENFGTMTIADTTISGNSAVLSGGGIYNASGTLSISHSTITSNNSQDGGGIFNDSQAGLAISDSTISGNSASYGGGIYSDPKKALVATVTNSTISGNIATQQGGGIYSKGPMTVSNSTIANNTAATAGGGIVVQQGAFTIISTIVAGNNAGSAANDVLGTLASGSTNNLIQDSTNAGGLVHGVANNILGADPLLGDLQGNGGLTQTHRIDYGSPAIGAGINPLNLTTDQRGSGYARTRGSAVDIGAYERGVAPTIGSLSVSSATVAPGGSITLTANDIADADGTISQVLFLLDDGDGVAEGDAGQDTLIGFDSDASNGFSVVYAVPGDAPPGDKTIFAVALDDENSRSEGTAATVNVASQAPTIGSVTLSSLRVREGTPVVLTANNVAAAAGRSIARVEFVWFKSNDPYAPNIVKIGQDDNGSDGWTFPLDTSRSGGASPIRAATAYYAVAVDDLGNTSTQVYATDFDKLVILAFPLVSASAGSSGNLNITSGDAFSSPTIFQQAAGATTWTKSDLVTKSGSPAITGEVVTWVDPKDGRNYAAGVSAQGVILFTNTSGSSWTFRNLSTEVTGMPLITGSLTTFTSTDRKVNIAGVAASGDLVRYVQTGAGASGNYTWTAVNHGEELRSRGMTMPQFVGRVTSFVTSWNALNIVGLDANGQIQAVWWHQSFDTGGKWTTNNLSQEYGAPQLTGGLTVWLTSWNAINIAGTDTSGKLSATWWVAGQNDGRWLTNNLTDDADGPLLEPSSMCSWVTPWGAMNIAGREYDGTISVYWWVPGVNNDFWNIEHFREEVPGATITSGPITGITALSGGFSMSILSTSTSGDVMRLWWTPATDTWAEQNLTQTATNI